MLLSDENLRGRTVIAADGGAIGNVGAIFLDSDTWQVKSLYVRLRKDIADRLGAERSLFHAGTVEIPTSLVQSVGDAVLLTLPVTELKQLLPSADKPTLGS